MRQISTIVTVQILKWMTQRIMIRKILFRDTSTVHSIDISITDKILWNIFKLGSLSLSLWIKFDSRYIENLSSRNKSVDVEYEFTCIRSIPISIVRD